MVTLIGHASIDENGKVSGGVAGDQSGKEVCTRSFYNSSWKTVLRCKDSIKAEIMAKACEDACNNPYIGYDQRQRNTLRTAAVAYGYNLKNIKSFCECDCSSFMAVCAECAGIKVPYSGQNAPTTATMVNAFTKTGMFDAFAYTGAEALKRGDILVKSGHTVMVLSCTGTTNNNKSQCNYVKGKTYTLKSDLYIREQPFGEKMKFGCITKNAQMNSVFDAYGHAILKTGTRVTCKDVKKLTDSTWILIPSGWICAINGKKIYIS